MDKLAYAVEPGLLFGRPGPNKSRWNLDALKLRGLAVVVSLVHIEDPKAVARAGLKHYVIPFEDRLYQKKDEREFIMKWTYVNTSRLGVTRGVGV